MGGITYLQATMPSNWIKLAVLQPIRKDLVGSPGLFKVHVRTLAGTGLFCLGYLYYL